MPSGMNGIQSAAFSLAPLHGSGGAGERRGNIPPRCRAEGGLLTSKQSAGACWTWARSLVTSGQPQTSHPLRSSGPLENAEFVVCIPFVQRLEMHERGCTTLTCFRAGRELCCGAGLLAHTPCHERGPRGLQHHRTCCLPLSPSVTQIPLVASARQLNHPWSPPVRFNLCWRGKLCSVGSPATREAMLTKLLFFSRSPVQQRRRRSLPRSW